MFYWKDAKWSQLFVSTNHLQHLHIEIFQEGSNFHLKFKTDFYIYKYFFFIISSNLYIKNQ